MDVHSKNYTLCAMEPTIGAEDRIFGEVQVAPDYKEVICFIESLKMKLGPDNKYSIECGYEAGCLGYTLYHQLTGAGVPSLVWGGLTGGLIFYGVYTATNPCIWIGAVLLVLGFAAMMPYLTMIAPLYFEKTRTKVQVDALYTDVFTPVAELTGEAYQD